MTFRIIITVFLLSISLSTHAEVIKVAATVPEVAWLVKQIGGDRVEVITLNSGDVDLHFLEARIDYIIKLRNVDALCYSGLGLEEGWLPKVVQRAGNMQIMLGKSGNCNLGQGVDVLNRPKGMVDRSMGHIHPQGNPHYTSDPLSMIKAASIVKKTLTALKKDDEKFFNAQYLKLKDTLTNLHQEISRQLSKIKNRKVLSYHSEFNYWIESYKFENMGMLEDKPGMPPSAGRLAKVARLAKEQGVGVILYTDFNNHTLVSKFQKLSQTKMIKLPAHAQNSEPDSYREWQLQMAKRLLDEFNLKF